MTHIPHYFQIIISDGDTTEIEANISLTRSNTVDSRNEALELQVEAKSYQETHTFTQHNIDEAERLVHNGSLLVYESDELLRQANTTVRALEVAFSSLNTVETNSLKEAISDIASLLSSLESEVSSADIEMLYLSLYQTLSEQKAQRQELESSLNEIQQEVEHFRRLESMLPQACNSNL